MKKYICTLVIISAFILFNLSASAQRIGKAELTATIAGISSGDISKMLVLEKGIIQCTNMKYEIVTFSISAILKNSDIIAYYGTGNTLTISMKDMIQKMEPESQLIIENIEAKSSDDKFIRLPDIKLILK